MEACFMHISLCSLWLNCDEDVQRDNCTLYDLDLSSEVLQYDRLSNYTMTHRYVDFVDAYHLLCGEILQGKVI